MNRMRSDGTPASIRLRRPTAQGRSHSGSNSHASESSQEKNYVLIAPARASVPAAPHEPGIMGVELLVQQPGRQHLPNISHNGISKSINQMMYSMLKTGYKTYRKLPDTDRELWFRQFAQEFNRASGNTEVVRKAFHKKVMEIFGNQIYEWKQLWRKGKKPKFINSKVWQDLEVHCSKQETEEKSAKNSQNRLSGRGGLGVYVHNLGVCSMSSKEDQLDVIDLVESQKEAFLASLPLSDDGSLASTNLSRARVNEMVEEVVPKKKGRLVGLARRASSCPTSSQTSYVDLMIMEELQKKDDRIVALES
uniref:Uncharacterized protein n=1 Tax=Brassica oleracea var. oleracea TaxID=109376 RepID=A0A0D2ZR96_BRAOL